MSEDNNKSFLSSIKLRNLENECERFGIFTSFPDSEENKTICFDPE